MGKLSKNQEGFGAVAALLVLVIIVIIGSVGWYVWKNKNKLNNADVPTISSTSATQQNSDAGWKLYCTATKFCFKYPSNWVEVSGVQGAFKNLSDTSEASIKVATDSTPQQQENTAYIYSVDNLPNKGPALDIVGFIVNNKPEYEVMDSVYLHNVIKVNTGKTYQMMTYSYVSGSTLNSASIAAAPGPKSTAFTNLNQAKSWFTTSDAKTCYKILQSFYYQ